MQSPLKAFKRVLPSHLASTWSVEKPSGVMRVYPRINNEVSCIKIIIGEEDGYLVSTECFLPSPSSADRTHSVIHFCLVDPYFIGLKGGPPLSGSDLNNFAYG